MDIVKIIYFQDIFLFTYNIWKSANINNNFSNLGHNVNNFKVGVIEVVEFQILLYNFNDSKKVDVVKAYSLSLLGVYLIDNLIHLIISTPNKYQCKKDE